MLIILKRNNLSLYKDILLFNFNPPRIIDLDISPSNDVVPPVRHGYWSLEDLVPRHPINKLILHHHLRRDVKDFTK